MLVENLNLSHTTVGVELWNTNSTTVSGNNITNNEYGVYLDYSSNNKFYHNNFINNFEQVSIPLFGSSNVWDDGYPSGGNYWSDYVGVDEKSGPNQNQTGGDGIGDTPYVIDAYNRDRYPLMTPAPVIPEFSSAIILTLLMTLTTLAVAFTKKRLLRHRCAGAFMQRLKSAYLKL
jgi:parallel beta-helix repeat protein